MRIINGNEEEEEEMEQTPTQADEEIPNCSIEEQANLNAEQKGKRGKISPPPFYIYNVNIKEIDNKVSRLLGHDNFTIEIKKKI